MSDVQIVTLDNNETEKLSKKPKISSRGGYRANSGRPKGSTNKISPSDLLKDFRKQSGMKFHEFINQQILLAYNNGDHELVSKYLLGLGKYIIQDVKELDITSNGHTVGTSFTFPTIELDDWQDQ